MYSLYSWTHSSPPRHFPSRNVQRRLLQRGVCVEGDWGFQGSLPPPEASFSFLFLIHFVHAVLQPGLLYLFCCRLSSLPILWHEPRPSPVSGHARPSIAASPLTPVSGVECKSAPCSGTSQWISTFAIISRSGGHMLITLFLSLTGPSSSLIPRSLVLINLGLDPIDCSQDLILPPCGFCVTHGGVFLASAQVLSVE